VSGIECCKPRVYDHNEALGFRTRIDVFKAAIDRLSLKTADLSCQERGHNCVEKESAIVSENRSKQAEIGLNEGGHFSRAKKLKNE
jgi:hypothetical protein